MSFSSRSAHSGSTTGLGLKRIMSIVPELSNFVDVVVPVLKTIDEKMAPNRGARERSEFSIPPLES